MALLRIRNCTIWDVHYWRELHGGDDSIYAAPGQERTLTYDLTYTLGVKRLHIKPEGIHRRKAVNQNGIYYAVWNAAENEMDILSEEVAIAYPISPDNPYLAKWFPRLPDWMGLLNGQYTLDRYTIPGTHDSGTEKLAAGASHTQNFGIGRQLEDGIRFLDIRLDRKCPDYPPVPPSTPDRDELVVKHSCDDCDLSFVQVLDTCKAFLAAHPGETILMLVNKSGCVSDTIAAKFMQYLQRPAYAKLFYLADTMPTLDQVRGKIVLLRRFKLQTPAVLGLDLSEGWLKDETFTLITPQGQHFVIEDQYKEHDTPVKLKVVKANITSAMQNPANGTMYITYNSVAFNISLHTPYQYAWGGLGINPAMNPALQSFLSQYPGPRHFGVVVLDYYNNKGSQNENVEMLVAANAGLRK